MVKWLVHLTSHDRTSLVRSCLVQICLAIPYCIVLGWIGFVNPNFLAILLCFWLFAQTLDLVVRIRQGPVGLGRKRGAELGIIYCTNELLLVVATHEHDSENNISAFISPLFKNIFLAKHPMFTIAEQMKPKQKNPTTQPRGVDISNWDGTKKGKPFSND